MKCLSSKKTQLLLALVGVLAVILVIAVIVAVSLGGSEPPVDTVPPTTLPLKPLTLTQPEQQTLTHHEKTLVFSGTADPRGELTVNGASVIPGEDGSFTYEVSLTRGTNEIRVCYEGEETLYTVEHRYDADTTWLKPTEDLQCDGGSTLDIQIAAREGSAVQAALNGEAVQLAASQEGGGLAPGFMLYIGSLRLPAGGKEDKDLGAVEFTVTCEGQTYTYTGGRIVCKKKMETTTPGPTVTPGGGKYMEVGSGYIVEIVAPAADTFYGNTRDDYSDPRNNYLPEGTVDYGSTKVVYDTTGKISYRLLRCGYRVYVQRKNYPATGPLPVVKCYEGTLPDHNEIGFGSMTIEGSHTVLTLDSMWKAPFYLNILPQTYNDTAKRDYTISKLTAEYVEITFCYATKFSGTVQIPSDNPLFRSAELVQNESDCTLRLYLKNKGVFYGWDSYYNDRGQLCFRFLNPVKAQKADNAFGANLSGIRIMVDVGHGGIDGGTSAASGGKTYLEAERNLVLANLLKEKLESMGATVILNRTGDTNLTVDQRIQTLKETKPDLCIAIHHNSYAADSSVGGGEVIYFTPQSQKAANAIFTQVKNSGVYNKTRLKSGVYFVARESTCPVVLMECGYMSNPKDLAGCISPEIMDQKAKDMAQGIANYFLSN